MERATTMAGMKRMRGKWYARIRTWDGTRERERLIPLTPNGDGKSVAWDRLRKVSRKENDIKQGREFSFAWLNEDGETKVKYLTLQEAVDQFLKEREADGFAGSTLKRNTHSLNALMNVVGRCFPVNRFTSKQIEEFKGYYHGKHTRHGININIRLIKTFLRWCYKMKCFPELPEVRMMKTPKDAPRYLTEGEWGDIVKNEGEDGYPAIDPQFIRAFHFYRETGCRLAEPFYGKLDGNWLIIPAEYTKQKMEKEVRLTDDLGAIWREMKSRFDNRKTKNERDFINRYSKEFKRACRNVGIDHRFHDLRHTFGIKRWLESGDIYLVKQEMGHASVTTTEKYTKFSLRRLAHDFPSLAQHLERPRNERQLAIRDTDIRDTKKSISTV